MAQIAQQASTQGHRCVFFVRDLHIAALYLIPALGELVQTPVDFRQSIPHACRTSACRSGGSALTSRTPCWRAQAHPGSCRR